MSPILAGRDYAQHMLESFESIDPARLTRVVRHDQSNPDFEVVDWTVQILSDRGAVNPDGLLLFTGQGHDGKDTKPWSVVLKILKKQDEQTDPGRVPYWKREALAYESGWLESLPGPVMPARCYGVHHHPDSAWVWMEHIAETTTEPWDYQDYAFAADQLGRFNGRCATGGLLPEHPWLARDHPRAWTPLWNFDNAWRNPEVRRFFPEATGEHLARVWAERESFFDVLDRSPQVFSHFDYKRSNLFLRQGESGHREVVAVDWGDCGVGALGGDLGLLVGGSAAFGDFDSAEVADLDAATFEAYMRGLREEGWHGNLDLVRVAFCAWFILYFGVIMPAWVENLLAQENREAFGRIFRRPLEELPEHWVLLCEYSLDLADETRRLMERIDLT